MKKLAKLKQKSLPNILKKAAQKPISADTLVCSCPFIANWLSMMFQARVKRPVGQPYIPSPSIADLNKNSQDYLVCDVLLTEEQLDYWYNIMPDATATTTNASSISRKKRKAAFDYQYPNNIWTVPIPYTLDSSLSKCKY